MQYSRRTCWLEGKFALFWMLATWGREQTQIQKPSPPLPSSGQELLRGSFRGATGGGRGLLAETARSAPTGILKSVISGRTSVTLIVLGTVNHELVPLSCGVGEDS